MRRWKCSIEHLGKCINTGYRLQSLRRDMERDDSVLQAVRNVKGIPNGFDFDTFHGEVSFYLFCDLLRCYSHLGLEYFEIDARHSLPLLTYTVLTFSEPSVLSKDDLYKRMNSPDVVEHFRSLAKDVWHTVKDNDFLILERCLDGDSFLRERYLSVLIEFTQQSIPEHNSIPTKTEEWIMELSELL